MEQQQQQQQQKLVMQQQQQQQQQQQFLLLQQLQKQAAQQQQRQAAAISRFPSNIDAHLRAPRPPLFHNPNPNSTPISSSSNPGGGLIQPPLPHQQKSGPTGGPVMPRPPPPPVNQSELQMAYQDALRVCHPDFRRPFASLEDACERLLPYHVVADYEAEEDDRILDSDTTGMMPSRCQQWDHNIAAKVAEFTATFEKQALAFNLITRKRTLGEFRSEERLMIEQALLQEEKRLHFDLKTEMEAREKAGREAQLRMAAMVQAEQVRAESHARAEMMTRGPIRANALGLQENNMAEQEHNVNPEEMMNGWGNNAQRDEKEPSEDFLNDEENENGDAGTQSEWREVGEFDLNTR